MICSTQIWPFGFDDGVHCHKLHNLSISKNTDSHFFLSNGRRSFYKLSDLMTVIETEILVQHQLFRIYVALLLVHYYYWFTIITGSPLLLVNYYYWSIITGPPLLLVYYYYWSATVFFGFFHWALEPQRKKNRDISGYVINE